MKGFVFSILALLLTLTGLFGQDYYCGDNDQLNAKTGMFFSFDSKKILPSITIKPSSINRIVLDTIRSKFQRTCSNDSLIMDYTSILCQDNGIVFLLDTLGNIKSDSLLFFRKKLSGVYFAMNSDSLWGVYGSECDIQVPLNYDDILETGTEGKYWVKRDSLWGLKEVGTNGQDLNFSFNDVVVLSDTITIARKKQHYVAFNIFSNSSLPLNAQCLSINSTKERSLKTSNQGKYGFYVASSNFKLEPIYDEITLVRAGNYKSTQLIKAILGDSVFFFSQDGKLLITSDVEQELVPLYYSKNDCYFKLKEFDNHYELLYNGNRINQYARNINYRDRNQQIIIELSDSYPSGSSRMTLIFPRLNNKVINDVFSYKIFDNGMITIKSSDNSYSLYNSELELISEHSYGMIESKYNSAFLRVQNSDGFYEILDQKGNQVVSGEYEFISFSQSEGYPWSGFIIRKKGKFGFVDQKGDIVIEPIYDVIRAYSNGLSRAKRDNKWGFLNLEGKEVIPFEYDRVSSFKNGTAEVLKGDFRFTVDIYGKCIANCPN